MEQFLDKIYADYALKGKFDAILKKREDSRDVAALVAELTALAQTEGFNISKDDISSALKPKGELNESQLENVSGGCSGLAICMFEYLGYGEDILKGEGLARNGPTRKTTDGFESKCGHIGHPLLCNWAGCRCWDTSHCKDGYHKCGENGKAFG